ncbi:MAG: 16S rRNA (uracil(1498)-N(3))-methyltransferase [Dictyoglomus sp.]|nr:16S rRNA (uracil(1498)-N(3))-methyltransferase [Dictyoglomus sp.]MCX7941681.1 16S rRNA (uracil(1498)-N(3))-methyltransferase [Dictyoglomaceae bacterium]MDW8188167.1 RsmE family RNA methyltransferase [Dictyoglomus sp.]
MSPLFFADEFKPPRFLILKKPEEIFHLIKVLRYRKGEDLVLKALDGNLYLSKIIEIQRNQVIFEIITKIERNPEINFEIYLCQSLPKLDKWEWILEKATELGVSGFFPLQTERSIVNLEKEKLEKKYERWRKIINEAVKQSERKRVPDLFPILRLEKCLDIIMKEKGNILVAWEKADLSLKKVISNIREKIYLFIGPEGSFSEEEIEILKKNGGIFFNMGPRILKVETASIVALSLVLYEKGGLGLE